jgi:5'-3' exoribonuclease 2
MGVPAFFKWLTIRYPQVVIDALSEEDFDYYFSKFSKEKGDQAIEVVGGRVKDSEEVEVEIRIRNKIDQNNPKVDNLYLDMNGIIHPCCRPQGKPAPKSEVEMFNLIFEYIDKIVGLVKPKKTLYMAVDGVAPRAKMNQ